jgi:UDP:flavonoid glycosyltransferase YjiC (YdhE family)
MAKYVFFNFPAYGHVNPTLAIAAELIARGEEVVYYLPERFRQTIEATGATFHPYQSALFTRQQE